MILFVAWVFKEFKDFHGGEGHGCFELWEKVCQGTLVGNPSSGVWKVNVDGCAIGNSGREGI